MVGLLGMLARLADLTLAEAALSPEERAAAWAAGQTLTLEQLRAWGTERLARYKLPSRLESSLV